MSLCYWLFSDETLELPWKKTGVSFGNYLRYPSKHSNYLHNGYQFDIVTYHRIVEVFIWHLVIY